MRLASVITEDQTRRGLSKGQESHGGNETHQENGNSKDNGHNRVVASSTARTQSFSMDVHVHSDYVLLVRL
jgi:hypothetical protein